ncbi:MAG: hypothetical protein KBF29_11450, partial [Sterolibacterium sp.]|nr:hypothetical protein [Sterolibacterium sp.]
QSQTRLAAQVVGQFLDNEFGHWATHLQGESYFTCNLLILKNKETLIKSFPRRRESSKLLKPWIPAFAGMTKSGLLQRFPKETLIYSVRPEPVEGHCL